MAAFFCRGSKMAFPTLAIGSLFLLPLFSTSTTRSSLEKAPAKEPEGAKHMLADPFCYLLGSCFVLKYS
ncbi:hypothetical protein NDU88_002026 [Pleurodeles waltl]|uniref:Uncharacterized protein n=1 Tax=Pleurodeles waltl TaxID=8319 RepID=A0AAV7QAH6_PLEWA|nr:hypothetical protein NDU88_002026 [Pleurodeles waltl]